MPTFKKGPLEGAGDMADRRRDTGALEPLVLDASDFDPDLGTLIRDRFLAIRDAESRGQGGAYLVVDLAQSSHSSVAILDEPQPEILQAMAGALRQAIRAGDLIAHLEDYRFAILLRGAPQHVAAAVAERIHQSVANTIFFVGEGIVPLSVEVGGTLFAPVRDHNDPFFFATSNLELARLRGVVTLIS